MNRSAYLRRVSRTIDPMNSIDAKALLTHGPSLALARAATYEQVALFARNQWNFMRLMRCFLPLLPRGTPVNKIRVLWSYAIVTHPEDAFRQYGALEDALFHASERMLTAFESILADVICGEDAEQAVEFPALVRAFLQAYEQWEQVEKPLVVPMMIERLAKLVLARRTARDHATLDREIYIQRKRMRRVMGFFRERHISETMGLEPLD